MSKAEERALKAFPDYKMFDGRYVTQKNERSAYIAGYYQAEKDLLENKHEKSWRLDEKLWKGIKDIEEASYQYMYDASNDWAYDTPTWEDVQDAFKAGSEWKEDLALTWKDIIKINGIIKLLSEETNEEILTKDFCLEVLNRFKKLKEK